MPPTVDEVYFPVPLIVLSIFNCGKIHTKLALAQQWKVQLPMQETRVLPLGGEDSLEKEMVIHSSILAWEIPWTEDLQFMGLQELNMT